MSGSKPPCGPQHGWTLDALERHLGNQITAIKESIEEMDDRNRERFAAAKEQVQLALIASDKAVTKADAATERRFEGVNEFRAALSDQSATLLTRNEYNVAHQNLTDKLARNEHTLSEIAQRILKLETTLGTKDAVTSKTTSTVVAIISICYGVVASIGVIAAFIIRAR